MSLHIIEEMKYSVILDSVDAQIDFILLNSMLGKVKILVAGIYQPLETRTNVLDWEPHLASLTYNYDHVIIRGALNLNPSYDTKFSHIRALQKNAASVNWPCGVVTLPSRLLRADSY